MNSQLAGSQLRGEIDAIVAAWCDWMAQMGWQVAVLAGVLTAVCWLLRRRSARLRYALWLLVPLRLALPPGLAFATGWSWWLLPPSTAPGPDVGRVTATAADGLDAGLAARAPTNDGIRARRPLASLESSPGHQGLTDTPAQAGSPAHNELGASAASPHSPMETARSDAESAVADGRPTWPGWLLAGWGAVVLFHLARLGLGALAARRLVAQARAVPESPLQQAVEYWRGELRIRQPVEVRLLPGSPVPMVVGVFRPCIILPDEIEQRLEADELQAVLIHELQHVARCDALVNVAQSLMLALYFFHPAAWWADIQLRRLREDACDEATVARLRGRRRAYGSGMVKMAEMLVAPPKLALGVAESGLQVKRRLERIFDPRLPIGLRLGWPEWLLLVVAAAVLLPAAAQPARSAPRQTGKPSSDASPANASTERDGAAGASERAVSTDEKAREKIEKTTSEVANRLISVKGRVIDPEGEPVAGAEVTVWWHFGYTGFYNRFRAPVIKSEKPRFGALSDADGRFQFAFASGEVDENPMNIWGWPGRHALVVAAAKGYGPAWASLEKIDNGEFTLKLVPDDVPIQGRVLDLAGRPVAGARVSVERVTNGDDEFRSLWQTTWAGLPGDMRTDAEGRFAVTGIGRGRSALLHVDGPAIEHQVVQMTIPAADASGNAEPVQVEIVAGPTKPVEGVIRALGTGEPLAGVVVCGEEERYHRRVRATTDSQGRYRLLGLPKADKYSLSINPPRALGYLSTIRTVSDSEGLKPIALNVDLRKGVPVRCRYIDKVTRQPVWGGDMHYTPLAPNPFHSEAGSEAVPTREYSEAYYAPDGEGFYHFVAWPGLGVLGFMPQAVQGKYLPMPLDPADVEKAKGDRQLMFAELMLGSRIIEPEATDELDLEIELDPGQSLAGSLFSPDGKPVAGATAYGLNFNDAESRIYRIEADGRRADQYSGQLATEAFTVTRVESNVPRTISFLHRERKLIGHAVLNGDEAGPLIVRADPWGTIAGRIVDSEGKGVKDVRVNPRYASLPAPGMVRFPEECKTDDEGRFHLEGLVPGLEIELGLTPPAKGQTIAAGEVLKKLVVEAGKQKELGEIKVQVATADSSN